MAPTMRKIGKDTEQNRMFYKFFYNPHADPIEIGEEKFIQWEGFIGGYEILNAFQVRNDDVFVLGHPKTGTTWLDEMVLLLLNDLDYNLSETFIQQRLNILEMFTLVPTQDVFSKTLQHINEKPSPRCITSHLPWPLLPEQIRDFSRNPKIIYVYRNPMDTCCSYYHFNKLLRGNVGEFEDYCKLFMEGRVPEGPFDKCLLSYWNQRERPNILFVTYKEMKNDLESVIKRVATFLNKSYGDDQIIQLAKHLGFEETKQRNNNDMGKGIQHFKELLKNNSTSTNSFYRMGQEGTYKSEMSPELIKQFENWIKDTFAGTGLTF